MSKKKPRKTISSGVILFSIVMLSLAGLVVLFNERQTPYPENPDKSTFSSNLKSGNANNNKIDKPVILPPSPTPTPTPTDPIIKCQIHNNCGGGIKEMSKSQCDELTCCQVNTTDWEAPKQGRM